MPRSKKRKKSRERQAWETQAAQRGAEKKTITPEQYMRRRAFGWGLVVLAIAHMSPVNLSPRSRSRNSFENIRARGGVWRR